MKKLIILSLALLLILFTPFTSYAIDSIETEDISGLLYEWESNGYPDYVGHIVYDENINKYEIGLVDGNQANIDEIESQLSSTEHVVFGTAKYSYNELLRVQEEIVEDDDSQEIYGIGLGWTTIDGELEGFGESGNEIRVVLSTNENNYDGFVEKYQSQYGDMVHVEIGSPAVADEDIQEISDSVNLIAEDTTKSYLPLIIVLGIITFGIIIIGRNRFIPVKQSIKGENIDEGNPIGRKEVISAIRKSGVKPRDNVYKSIIKRIRE